MSNSSQIQTVAISGATGMVGSALADRLRESGKSVIAISRSDGGGYDDTIRWDPESGLTNPNRLESVDAIVHLAGENIAAGRWNDSVKRRIRNSRVNGTRSLVESMASVEKRPKLFICASAIGYYGDRGSMELPESAEPGEGFLPDVCKEWEAEADAAAELGCRVVNVRIGMVLSPKGGALAKMLLPFKLGAGGVVGPGTQYWSWIGLHDLTRIIAFCIDNEEMSGPVNAVSPHPPTNREFTKDLGRVLNRPTIIPMPAFAAKLALGEMAKALLLASTRVVPKKLEKAGFKYDHPDLTGCLQHELS
ncbi:TIGR01777 family oxidoreductase [Fuerstiella marisgermanici]|nr:TIGR01777 family oxidoreductase [Fuerstiella marisgermanici]